MVINFFQIRYLFSRLHDYSSNVKRKKDMDCVADRGLKVASSSSALSTSHYRDFGYLALITLLHARARFPRTDFY